MLCFLFWAAESAYVAIVGKATLLRLLQEGTIVVGTKSAAVLAPIAPSMNSVETPSTTDAASNKFRHLIWEIEDVHDRQRSSDVPVDGPFIYVCDQLHCGTSGDGAGQEVIAVSHHGRDTCNATERMHAMSCIAYIRNM